MLLDVAGPLEALRRANHEQTSLQFDVRYVGASSSILSSIGLAVKGIEPLPSQLPDEAMVIVPGTVDEVMSPLGSANQTVRERGQESTIVAWLRAQLHPAHQLVTICSGALLAGRAGLMDGRACTTHYSSCAELAAAAPKAKVLESRLYVRDGNCYSSAGVTAGIDLMLFIISELIDHRCAAAVARYLVVYLRRTGSDPQLSPWLDGRNHIHPAVHRVQDAMTADPADAWSVAKLTRVAGTSSRHLTRLFHEHTGMNISDYRNRLRVALAHELLTQTQLDMERVAERAGFESTRQLRRVWKKIYPTSPRDARAAVSA